MSLRNEEGAVLGLLVVLLRSLRRWSQADLAKASGIHKSQISDYERWKSVPSEATLRKLAAASGVPWADVCAVLPALRALYRLATRPADGRRAFPGARRISAAVGRAATEAFERDVRPFLREHLPILADPAAPIPTLPMGWNVEPAALGLLIVLLRSLRHWSQVQLASASGVQRSQISTYELGDTQPRRQTLERLATAVGVPLGEALEVLPFLREILEATRGTSAWRRGTAEAIGRLAADLVPLEMGAVAALYFPAVPGAET
jgi:transcriptional regulator with XRE-family HTH domain